MPAPAVLALLATLALPPDSTVTSRADSGVGPVLGSLMSGVQLPTDTVRRRRKSIEVSEWYERRLRIHRYGSYAVYPLFAFQALAGTRLYRDSRDAPGWAKTGHRVAATGLAVVFTANTVTGLWNLWDSRNAPGAPRRYTHALFMLASDAGFTYAGVKLSDQAEISADKRSEHRTWAIGSMATALTGMAVMKYWPEGK